MKVIVTTLFFFGVLLRCYAVDDYERCVEKLGAGIPEADTETALRKLHAAGASAFSTLVAHLDDQHPAQPRYFQRDAARIAPDGSFLPYEPTIGDACFDIFQGQIEGHWPKAYRQYYVLTAENAKQWFEAHRSLPLSQLRRVAHKESLRRARADLAAHPSSKFFADAVAFLRKELKDPGNTP